MSMLTWEKSTDVSKIVVVIYLYVYKELKYSSFLHFFNSTLLLRSSLPIELKKKKQISFNNYKKIKLYLNYFVHIYDIQIKIKNYLLH